jgi:hypothetical protein
MSPGAELILQNRSLKGLRQRTAFPAGLAGRASSVVGRTSRIVTQLLNRVSRRTRIGPMAVDRLGPGESFDRWPNASSKAAGHDNLDRVSTYETIAGPRPLKI